MEKTRIVMMGTPDFAVPVLEALLQKKYNVVAIVSQPDRPRGRKHETVATPLKASALSYGLPVLQPEKLKLQLADVLAYKPDLVITCAYGQMLPQALLDSVPLGVINVHASLLPKWRGGAPIQHAILNGDLTAGVTIMKTVMKMDAGPMALQHAIPIDDADTYGSLYTKLSQVGAAALLQALPAIIAGEVKWTAQPDDEVTIALNIRKEDEHIDFNKDVKVVYNHIRALIPAPNGYALIEAKKIKFHAVTYDSIIRGLPGQIIDLYPQGIAIGAQAGTIFVERCQLEGKGILDAAVFWNGQGKLYKGGNCQ